MKETAVTNKLWINGREVEFSNERNLLEVIRKAGYDIPTFCYRADLTIYGACRMCVVEIEGRGVQASCTIPPEAGLKIHINTERTRRIRKIALELLLANHDRECTTCVKSGKCDLQDAATKLGVKDVRFPGRSKKAAVDTYNPSVIRDPNKCILCGACVRVCHEIQGKGVLGFANRGSKMVVTPAFNKNLNEVDCVFCGQCVAACPTAALQIKSDVAQVWKNLLDAKKTIVVQVAPAVRVAIGEAFGLPPGENSIGIITAALRRIGFKKIFDTTFTADMTILEEAAEFVDRFSKKENLPLFTSCCPAWVRFAEQKYPQYLDNLSTCRSPQQMFGSLAKKILPEQYGIEREDLVVVSIMPCTAKKAESRRPEFRKENNLDVDYVLTTQELIQMIGEAGVDFHKLTPEAMDAPFGEITGAGVIFGASGGVAEAAVRTAYRILTGKDMSDFRVKQARGIKDFKEIALNISGTDVNIAVVNTLSTARELMDKLSRGEVHYDMVEVMACPGGCIGGAGQPQSFDSDMAKVRRASGLYKSDELSAMHCSHCNHSLKSVYDQFLGEPNSEAAHEALHTVYKSQRRINGQDIKLGEKKSEHTVDIKVCVGTSCYLRGSYDFMQNILKEAEKQGLQDKVHIRATFCLENCANGPSVSVDGELVSHATPDKAVDIFKKYIAAKCGK